MRKIPYYVLSSADCIFVLPVALLVSGSVRFLPAAAVITIAGQLQKFTSYIPLRMNNQYNKYSRWTRALGRIQKYLKIGTTCLGRAIILRTMLRTSGIPAEIKLGVKGSDELLVAHAWIQIPGVHVDESDREHYIEFFSHPFQ